MTTLKECCTLLIDGDWIESKDQSASGIRLIQTGNIGDGVFLEKASRAKYISEETFNRLGCTEVFPGDILVSRLPSPVGRACVVPEKTERMITAVDCSILRVDKDIINPEYLHYYLRSSNYFNQLSAKLAGTTRVRVSRKNLEKVTLAIPSGDDQIAVVDTLRHVDVAIRLQQRELALFADLVKSRFVEMFGTADEPPDEFEIVTVNDICSSIIRGPFGSALKKEFFVPKGADTYKVYEQKHAIQKRSDIGSYYVTAEKYATLKRFECFPGDILMSCSGTMGELYQLPEGCERGIMNQALCKFTLNDSVLPDYFFGFMSQVVDELGAKGSGIKNVSSVKYIKAIKIPLPPIALQQEFAAFVQQVDKSKAAVQKAIEKLELLKASLMQEYFG